MKKISMHEELSCIEFLTVIAGRKMKGALLDALTEAGAMLLHTAYGKSSVQSSHLKEMLGLVPEEHKVLITCLMPRDKVGKALDILTDRFCFNKPNTGIAFTIPIEKLSL